MKNIIVKNWDKMDAQQNNSDQKLLPEDLIEKPKKKPKYDTLDQLQYDIANIDGNIELHEYGKKKNSAQYQEYRVSDLTQPKTVKQSDPSNQTKFTLNLD